jgi:precorrin-6B methylase 2
MRYSIELKKGMFETAARNEHRFAVPLLQLHEIVVRFAAPEVIDDVPYSIDAACDLIAHTFSSVL